VMGGEKSKPIGGLN